jgi:integrase
MPAQKLTQEFVDQAKALPGMERTHYFDDEPPGFCLTVTKNGAKSFALQYRPRGKRASKRMTLQAGLKLKDARKQARVLSGVIANGGDPLADRRAERAAEEAKRTGRVVGSLKAITDDYFEREGKKLRTAGYRRHELERLVLPRLGKKQIGDISRADIIDLLDDIEDQNGPVMADRVLAYLRRVFNWYAARSDTFRSPIVRGMARTKPRQRRRKRVLSDIELRAIWQAAEMMRLQGIPEKKTPIAVGVFASLVQFLLLTACRRDEAANAVRSELVDGKFIIPPERYKTDQHLVVPLSASARDVLAKMPKIGKQWIFTTSGTHPFSGFSKAKAEFDKRVIEILRKDDPDAKLERWTIHDLRRTARTLMSRAKVDNDIAERCVGHARGDMQETYDMYSYLDERREAFEALAGLIARIVEPHDNLVDFPKAS